MKKLKWLFAILILLNITVFIYLSRLSDRRTEAIHVTNVQEVNANWLRIDNTSDSQPVTLNSSEPLVNDIEETSAPQQPEAKPEQTAEASAIKEELWCLAAITLKEEDYSALKTRLAGIPHKVNKIETKQSTNVKVENEVLYWVHTPAAADTTTQIRELASHGLNQAKLEGDQISLGLLKDANLALNLKLKAFDAGFTQTNIKVQIKPAQTKMEEKIVTSYQINFANMDKKLAKKAQDQLKIKVKIPAKTCEN